MSEIYHPTPEEPHRPEVQPREKILHREKMGFGEYIITAETPEVMERWHQQVQEIVGALRDHDLEKLLELMKNGKYKLDQGKTTQILEQEIKNEEAINLFGIALWILRELDKYPGDIKIATKMLKGGRYNLSSFLKLGGKPWCLDSTVLAKAVAETFGIEGDIVRTKKRHRYFQSESGKIVDVYWGRRRGGFFPDTEQWNKEKITKDRHICGVRFERRK